MAMNKLEIEVKITSSQTIKPSKLTPSHLKTYKLSLVDQTHPVYYSIMQLYYPKSTKTPPLDINNVLKTSLSKTLTEFYPFAGRCNDDFTISCNDQGIPFVETQVNCNLNDFLNSPNKIDLMHDFMPSQDQYIGQVSHQRLPELPPLALQLNVFTCGGFVLGCYKLHKTLLDGTSLSTFLKYWAAVASDRYDSLVQLQPNVDAVVTAFPHRLSKDWLPPTFVCPYDNADDAPRPRIVAKSFIFTKEAINKLREAVTSESVPKPSRFVALAAFVWKHCIAAANATGTIPTTGRPFPTVMQMLVNLRPRLNPPIPNTSIGNLITTASARGEVATELPDLALQIHAAISHVPTRIECYQGEKAAEALLQDVTPTAPYKPGHYVLSSWCQFRLDKVDFGLGEPKWASPTDGWEGASIRNFLHFVSDASGDGIEVWLDLEEREMQVLMSNTQFLAFGKLIN